MDLSYITIDLVKYPTEVISHDQIEMENKWGLNGLHFLRKRNPSGDAAGYFGNFDFYVYIDEEENKVTVEVNYSIIESNGGSKEQAMLEAIGVIETHYPSVGWEFLSTKGF
jgi:hypothetical protein